MFEPLIIEEENDERPLLEKVNPNSWKVMKGFVENCKEHFDELERFQFIRDGYYAVDKESKDDLLVFNRIAPLKSSVK